MCLVEHGYRYTKPKDLVNGDKTIWLSRGFSRIYQKSQTKQI